MLSKQAVSSKIAIFGLMLMLLFLGNLKYRQWQAQKQIQQQEQSLQNEADQLQKKNDDLNQSLQYLNSPDFKEQVARQDLGLKKNGETVYSFDSGSQTQASSNQASAQPNLNAQKWWDYFFGND